MTEDIPNETEIEAEIKNQTEVEDQTDIEAEMVNQTEIEAEIENQTEVEDQTDIEAEMVNQTEIEAEIENQTEVEDQTDIEAEMVNQTEIEAEMENQIEIEAEVENQTEIRDYQMTPRSSEDPERAKGLVSVIIIPSDEAWLALTVAFWQNFFLESIPLSLLIFASKLPSHEGHHISSEQRYIVGATFLGLIYCFSPFSCGLINWFSFKTISIAGPTIATLAMIISYYAQEIFFLLIVSFCLVGGFGCSMINMTATCLPTVWFCNRRAIACKIAGLGSALGKLILPILIRWIFIGLLDYCILLLYWLHVGLFVILLAMGFLVPKIRAIMIQVNTVRVPESTVKFTDQEYAGLMARSMTSLTEKYPSYTIFRTFHNLVFPRVKDIIKDRGMFMLIPDDKMLNSMNPPWKNFWQRRNPVLTTVESDLSFTVVGVQHVRMVINYTLPGHGARPFYRVDIFFSSDVCRLKLYYKQMNQLDYHLAVTRAMSRRDYLQEVNKKPSKTLFFPEAISRTILTMLHCGIFHHLYYTLLQLALFFYHAGYLIPFIFIKDRGIEFNLGEDNSFLLLCSLGLGNIVGHLAVFSSHFCYDLFNRALICNGALLVQGIYTIVSNAMSRFESHLIYAAITGIIMGITASMDIYMICKFTGLHPLTNAVGHLLIFKGLGLIFGIILSAQLNSRMNSVQCSFILSGVFLIIASILLLPLKKLKSMAREKATYVV